MKKETIYYDDHNNVIKKKKLLYPDRFDETKGYLFWNQKQHCKVFPNIEYPGEMTDGEIGKLARLARHIYRDSNILAYRSRGGVKPHTIESMSMILGVKPKHCKEYISKMISLGVMAKSDFIFCDERAVFYFISPLYYFSGKRINNTLYVLFQKQLDPYLQDWVKDRFNGYKGGIKNYGEHH
jgi:hypothetical protein